MLDDVLLKIGIVYAHNFPSGQGELLKQTCPIAFYTMRRQL
jgi:hypothetical protein